MVFELPVVITLLSMLGLVTPQFLSKNRKYAILINFIIAAVLTPTPDIVNQTLMAGPLCILYELGIISARIFGRKKPAKPRRPSGAPPVSPLEFASLDLPGPVRRGIQDAGFVATTADPGGGPAAGLCAARTWPGQSQTGTGKTAAFLIAAFTRCLTASAPRRPA